MDAIPLRLAFNTRSNAVNATIFNVNHEFDAVIFAWIVIGTLSPIAFALLSSHRQYSPAKNVDIINVIAYHLKFACEFMWIFHCFHWPTVKSIRNLLHKNRMDNCSKCSADILIQVHSEINGNLLLYYVPARQSNRIRISFVKCFRLFADALLHRPHLLLSRVRPYVCMCPMSINVKC